MRKSVAEFRKLHEDDEILVLANAWDAGSAGLIARAGARAIATTSAGVAWAWGYPDGDVLPRACLLQTVEAVCRAAGNVPVSVDIESGFSDDPVEVGELARALCALGVVGVNLEDATASPDLLCEKIVAVKRETREAGCFVNARADVYLRDLVPEAQMLREAIDRAELYVQAGADGIFVPGVAHPNDIEAIVQAIPKPLNVLAVDELPPLEVLRRLGVRRISAGSLGSKLAYGVAVAASKRFLKTGDPNEFDSDDTLDYGATNASFSAH
jgi:2-methylisocitrate lyase-like PEP mutase family enzyme